MAQSGEGDVVVYPGLDELEETKGGLALQRLKYQLSHVVYKVKGDLRNHA